MSNTPKKMPNIFEALNNSLVFAVALVGLALYVYQNDQRQQDGRLDAASVVLKDIQSKQSGQGEILMRMQEAQSQIAKQIERNTDKLNGVQGNRFTDSDGNLLEDELEERIAEERTHRRSQYTEIRETLRSLERDIETIRQEVNTCQSCQKQ